MAESSLDTQTMTGFESIMWEMERDPQLASAFSNLSMLDQAPDRNAFRDRMLRAVEAVPRLSQRVVTSPFPWELPRWVDDPEMDIDQHLRWIDMGGHATRSDLYELVATLSRDPLDRERPLWQFVIIEGLADGRAAMLQRLHHTITDGEGGIRLSIEFIDFERNPPARVRKPKPERSDDRPKAPLRRNPAADTQSERDSTEESARSGHNRVELQRASKAVLNGPSDLLGAARSAARQARVGKKRSPLWTERSLGRWFGTTTLALEDVLTTAHYLGGSVNDVFIAGAASAAGRVHELAGMPVEELRVSMPVSTRHDRSAGGNAFSPTQMLVPTGPMKPAARVEAIHQIVVEVREERAIAAMEGAAGAAAMLPSAIILRTGQYLTQAVDFVCSNVRAAPMDLFIGGAHMQANYPIGPLAGTAFNLTTMSYRGWLYLGLYVDTAAVDSPQELLDALNDSYTELLASARLPRRQPDHD